MYVSKEDWAVIRDRPSLRYIPHDDFVDTEALAVKSNASTLYTFDGVWKRNLMNNLKRTDFHKHSVKELSKKHKGETICLVGFGPSLKDNIEVLAKKSFVKITSAHAMKYLLEHGVKPDYVCALDAVEKQADWLVNEPGVTLIADVTVHPKVLDVWKGPIYFSKSLRPQDSVGLSKISDFEAFISCGGNVMGMAYSISVGMGAEAIVFVGMDMANDMDYGTKYADGFKDRNFGQDYFLSIDIAGRGVMTSARMLQYKRWLDFQSFCQKPNHFNATEGGILGAYLDGNIKSIMQIPLEMLV